MKRLLIIALALCALSQTADAQGWLDAVKKVATEAADKATGGQLTAKAIVGTWNYSAPAARLDGDNALSSLSGSLAGSAISTKMAAAFEKVGIREGFCSITFNDDGTFAMPVKGKSVSGTYEFDPATHALTLHVGKSGLGSFGGYAYISGSNLQIVFPTDKLMTFLTNFGSKISALSSVTALLEKYDNAYLGFEFGK
ncbi:MAG: DUF4923 family protein [Alistipes sp.]|nr:DUF4923 family protein [Alistipes sp.]